VAIDLDDIEDAGRNTGFNVDLGQHHGSERRQRRRLEYNCVSSSQRWRGLPDRHLQRVIPCTNTTNDTERLSTCVTPAALRQRYMIT